MRALLVTLLLSGCAPSAISVPPIAPKKTSAPARAFEARLHVVARGWPGGNVLRTRMTLCPIDGAVFVCGGYSSLPALRGDEVVEDPALMRGITLQANSMSAPWIGAITGSWPTDAWLRVDSMENEHTFYRWRTDRWVQFSSVQASHAALMPRAGSPLQITRDFTEEGPAWIKLEAPLGGHLPDPYTPSWHSSRDTDIAELGAEVFVLDHGFPQAVVRFGAFTTKITAGEETSFNGLTNAVGKIVAFGANDGHPLIERLDGDRLLTIDASGLPAPVDDYASDARNEWAVVNGALYFRRDGGAFRALETGVRVERVWSTGEDDAWVFGTLGKEGVLLRTTAPSRLTKL